MIKPVVAIVGRPNVGKSTLFNRLVGGRVSIVEDRPSITRDRIYGDSEWLGSPFIVIDTGGIELDTENTIKAQMRYQAQIAIDEADVILFVVDVREGLSNMDRDVAVFLRQSNKTVILVANKAENNQQAELDKYDFYELGFGEPYLASAEHGQRIGDLLDEVISYFPDQEGEPYDDDTIKISVIGRPNVGKSSLVNKILGEERVIVSDIAGTTRDAIDTPFTHEDNDYVIIDTAGMRKKGKVDGGVERYSVIRSLRAVDRSDLVLMVLDAKDGITDQDKKIAGYAHDEGKGVIIVVNKWDLVEKDTHTMKNYTEELRYQAGFLNYAPVMFTSALTGKRVMELFDIINYVSEQHNRRISTNLLNSVLEDAVAMNQPPSNKHGKRLKILYATQPRVKPPLFVLFVNDPGLMHFSYKRYLENQIRNAFGFEGSPIKILARAR